MKVICQQCKATYAINDAAIPPKGARAQCPRCKHLQSVKREDSAAAPAQPALTTPAPVPPPLQAPRPSQPVGASLKAAPAADPFADLGLGSSPPPSSPQRAPPPADPFASLDFS